MFDEIREHAQMQFDNQVKSKALSYGNMLARRVNFMRNEELDVEEILRIPYINEEFEYSEVKKRLELMHPNNMITIFHS